MTRPTVDALLVQLGIDPGPIGPEDWRVLHAEWRGMGGINERRKWKIYRNGIYLLIAYLVLGGLQWTQGQKIGS